MPSLTDNEKRTLRRAAIAISIYLILFLTFRAWRFCETKRSDYFKLVKEAKSLKQELQPYENKLLLLDKLKETFHMNPAKLSKATLVAEASAAIQKAAQGGGFQLGPIRESAARPSARELTSMQIEGFGPVPAAIALLHRLGTLGYPVILDTVQINLDPTKPGMIKLNLTLVILDFEQWKTPEARNV